MATGILVDTGAIIMAMRSIMDAIIATAIGTKVNCSMKYLIESSDYRMELYETLN